MLSFKKCQNPKALRVRTESTELPHQLVQQSLACVAKWGMPNIVSKANGLDEISIRLELSRCFLGQTPAKLCDLKRMSKSSPIKIAVANSNNLSFALESPEGGAMNDSRLIDFKRGTESMSLSFV